MTEQGFPNSHTTTTVVQPTSSKSNVHLDLSYLHTTDGRIKCGEIVSIIVDLSRHTLLTSAMEYIIMCCNQ